MNIIKRLPILSVDDLQGLQIAILDEIHRRKDLLTERLALGEKKARKGVHSVPASKPAPSASPRRAA